MQSKALRRADRSLSEEDTRKVLARCQWGTLSYADDEGTLHSIPISYAVAGDNLYFHGAKTGTKWENLQKPRAATFVVATDVVADPEEFTTAFESVVLSGTVELVSDEAERRTGFFAVLGKYCSTVAPEKCEGYFREGSPYAGLWRLRIECMTGKRHE